MASYVPTIWSDARGSVAGATLGKGAGGNIVRARRVPGNPATSAQLATRQAVAALGSLWSNVLNPTQRAEWTLFGVNSPTTNAMGQPVVQSGLACYIAYNLPIYLYLSPTDLVSDVEGSGLRGAPGALVYPSQIYAGTYPVEVQCYVNAPVAILTGDQWYFFVTRPSGGGRSAIPPSWGFAGTYSPAANSTPPFAFNVSFDDPWTNFRGPGQNAWLRMYWQSQGCIGANTVTPIGINT